MYKHQYGFGFCTYVAEGSDVFASHDIGTGLVLMPEWRVKGFLCALQSGLIGKLYLMGKPAEVQLYRTSMLAEDSSLLDRIDTLATDQSTIGNAVDLWRYLDQHRISADQWALLTSDYHSERAVLTAELAHNVRVGHHYGTESLLSQHAFASGGEAAQLALMEEIMASVDPAEYVRRIMFETKGCAQLREDPSSYVPKKG